MKRTYVTMMTSAPLLSRALTIPCVIGVMAAAAAPANADIMRTCKSEIAAHCKGVPRGKGRIAACLFAHSAALSGECAADVAELSASRKVSRIVPDSVTELKGTEYEAMLRSACSADATKLCPGVSTNDERVLACLYARERELSKTCKNTGQRVLREIK